MRSARAAAKRLFMRRRLRRAYALFAAETAACERMSRECQEAGLSMTPGMARTFRQTKRKILLNRRWR